MNKWFDSTQKARRSEATHGNLLDRQSLVEKKKLR